MISRQTIDVVWFGVKWAYCSFLDGLIRSKLQKSCPWYNEGGDWHNRVYIKLWLLLNSGSFICWSDQNLYSVLVVLWGSSLDNLCRSSLFSLKRYIWETFCNFWHFSNFFFFYLHTVGDLFCFALICVGGAVALLNNLCQFH